MLIEIESVYGDTMLTGKPLSLDTLKSIAKEILKSHDERQFIAEFCAKLGYKELPYSEGYAAYTIDLDTHLVLTPSYELPKDLDGAKVLYYSNRGNFDPVYYPGGAIAHNVCYLAICKYDNDEAYYVFHCNESLHVVADDYLPSLDACMEYMDSMDTTWFQKKE